VVTNLLQRVRNKVRGILLASGPERIKRYIWNAEFAKGRWDHLARTDGDCLYPFLEKYGHDGIILDLGCGSGNTGAELAANAYHDYTGVDISDVAIEKAKKKAEVDGRTQRNHYFQGDIRSYEPTQHFDLILLRESIYYIPGPIMMATLHRYAKYLKPSGVIIVRLWTSQGKYGGIVKAIEADFSIVEKSVSGPSETAVLVFRQVDGRQDANSSEVNHVAMSSKVQGGRALSSMRPSMNRSSQSF
jgi:SAM-dependent methyltransferase